MQFKLTVRSFNTNKWLALFPGGAAPFHFLICPVPAAKVWHQRGWLNATPLRIHSAPAGRACGLARTFVSLEPELELPLSAGRTPDPDDRLVGPSARLYVGYDFQGARVAVARSVMLPRRIAGSRTASRTLLRWRIRMAASGSASSLTLARVTSSLRGFISKSTPICPTPKTRTSDSRPGSSTVTPTHFPQFPP